MQNPDPFLITEGIHNFRDFGGWLGADGRQVRTGLLYRSGQHVEASDADLAAIDALDIRTVIEGWDGDVLFYEGETSSSPPHMDITPETTTAEFARERMLAVYTRMPVNPAMQTMFARYLRALVERDGASLVHCFAGKDRTGIAATLVLHILGVSEADQRAEFLRTNDAPTIDVLRRQSVPGIEARLGRTLDEEGIRALLEVHGDYLDRFHAIVNESYGSLDAWLEAEIGVDDALREALRERYLT